MRLILILSALLLLCACGETVVDLDVPRGRPQLTVNGFFNPDSIWQVELSQNRSMLDTALFAPVPDAQVRVLQGGQTAAVLDYVGNARSTGVSFYRATGRRPQMGTDYVLQVDHPTLGSASATGRVPENQGTIVGANWDLSDTRVAEYNDVNTNRIVYGVTVRIDDPPGVNFYGLSFFVIQNLISYFDVTGDGQPELVAQPPQPFGGPTIRSDDPIVVRFFNRSASELRFSDRSFDGTTYALKIYMRDPVNFGQDQNSINAFTSPVAFNEPLFDTQGNIIRAPGEPYASYFTLYALLRTTSAAYYDYYYTGELQASVENNAFAQPVQVYDNIDGGLGIFAGFNQVTKIVTIQ